MRAYYGHSRLAGEMLDFEDRDDGLVLAAHVGPTTVPGTEQVLTTRLFKDEMNRDE